MGLLSWLFARRRRTEAQVEDVAAEIDERTTLVLGRLSPKAQSELKRLRQLRVEGVTRYHWECSQYGCFESKKYAVEGPYRIAEGLARAAPVPGRGTSCDCECRVAPADEPAPRE